MKDFTQKRNKEEMYFYDYDEMRAIYTTWSNQILVIKYKYNYQKMQGKSVIRSYFLTPRNHFNSLRLMILNC